MIHVLVVMMISFLELTESLCVATAPAFPNNAIQRFSAVERQYCSRSYQSKLLNDEFEEPTRKDTANTEDPFLGYAIDSFLRGEYDRPFAEDAPVPNPNCSPGETVEVALRALRDLDDPEPAHGAAVFLRFSRPLSRGERWGDSSVEGRYPWKELLRGSLTPAMFAARLRSSEFADLLDWSRLDVTEGAYSTEELVGVPNIAFVNVALYFTNGIEPSLFQFTLRRRAGVWLIDSVRVSKKDLFVEKPVTDESKDIK